MAIISKETDGELLLKLSDGDLAAIKTIKKKWGFRYEADIIRFALAVLIKADSASIVIEGGGKKQKFSPAESLLKDK